jgi:cell division protease FtsH
MVKEYGMSPKLGRLQYRDSQESVFLGASAGVGREYSESTAREIDMEVRRIVEETQSLVREILLEHREALEKLAERLLEKEVLDAHELKEVMDATSPRLVPGTSLANRLKRRVDPSTANKEAISPTNEAASNE